MLDFDSQRAARPDSDLRVKAGGVEFTLKPFIGLGPVIRFMDAPDPDSRRPQQDAVAAFRALLESAVIPEDLPKVDQLLADDNPQALLPRELQQLGWQIVGALSDRPTEQQSGSSPTSEAAGTTSTETSASTAED